MRIELDSLQNDMFLENGVEIYDNYIDVKPQDIYQRSFKIVYTTMALGEESLWPIK